MKMNERPVRNCLTCECYAEGCEEKCPFELQEAEKRPTLSTRRRKMKAEKANAYEKAMKKLNSTENKAVQETSYEKAENKRIRNPEKEIDQLEYVHEDKKYELFNAYPEAVFRARANAIKQGKRMLKRLAKEQVKK